MSQPTKAQEIPMWETLFSNGKFSVVKYTRNEKLSLNIEVLCECDSYQKAENIAEAINAPAQNQAAIKALLEATKEMSRQLERYGAPKSSEWEAAIALGEKSL